MPKLNSIDELVAESLHNSNKLSSEIERLINKQKKSKRTKRLNKKIKNLSGKNKQIYKRKLTEKIKRKSKRVKSGAGWQKTKGALAALAIAGAAYEGYHGGEALGEMYDDSSYGHGLAQYDADNSGAINQEEYTNWAHDHGIDDDMEVNRGWTDATALQSPDEINAYAADHPSYDPDHNGGELLHKHAGVITELGGDQALNVNSEAAGVAAADHPLYNDDTVRTNLGYGVGTAAGLGVGGLIAYGSRNSRNSDSGASRESVDVTMEAEDEDTRPRRDTGIAASLRQEQGWHLR